MAKIEDLSMKQRVYEYIRDMILTLELQPGDRIPENQIALDLGISRTPVREAVRLLAWEGLINVNPNHSATVVVVDTKMIQDLLLVRWHHDRVAIPLAVYNGSNRDFSELRTIASQCIEANDAGDLWLRHELDSRFHCKIIEIGKNQILYDLNARLSLVVRLWQALHITQSHMLRDQLQQHLELVDCLEARDTKKALEIIHNHSITSYELSLDTPLLTPQELFTI